MSQHDFNIANQSFPATRTDLNNALQALASNSSGDAEPSTTFANQWWYETDTNTLKLRNEANNAWLSFATVDQTTGDWTLAHDVIFGDNDKAIFGAGSDLQIYHNGSTSVIEDSGTGALQIKATDLEIRSYTTNENYIYCVENGAVTLYYNDAAKIATTATGIDVTGTVVADGLTFDVADFVNVTAKESLAFTIDSDNNQVSRSFTIFNDGTSQILFRAHDTGDISFYEDTGTTAKFFWDASLETLTLGGTEWPTTNIDESAGRHMINYDGEPRLLLWDVSTGAAGNEAHLMLGGKPTSSATIISGGSINGGVENASNAAGYLAFNTTESGGGFVEAARIDSSRNLLVGTTNNDPKASAVSGVVLRPTNLEVSTSGTAGLFNLISGTGTLLSFRQANTVVGTISVTASSTAYNTSSDYRLKTDAQPMTGASARVQALKPVNFEWISSGERVDGFLAHEAQAVVPEAVSGAKDAMRDEDYEVTAAIEATYDEDGNELTAAVEAVMGTRSVPDMQGIDQSKLVPLLTAALQEALNKIDAMEIRLAALEA